MGGGSPAAKTPSPHRGGKDLPPGSSVAPVYTAWSLAASSGGSRCQARECTSVHVGRERGEVASLGIGGGSRSGIKRSAQDRREFPKYFHAPVPRRPHLTRFIVALRPRRMPPLSLRTSHPHPTAAALREGCGAHQCSAAGKKGEFHFLCVDSHFPFYPLPAS